MIIFIPSFFVYFNHPGPYRNAYFFAVNSVLITVPFGIIQANILFRFEKQEIQHFFNKPFEHENYSGGFTGAFLIILAGAMIFVFLYIYEAQTIPLFYMIENPGEFFHVTQLREASFKLLKTSFIYPYEWLRFPIFPFLIILSFGTYLNTRLKKWLILFLVTLIIGTFYCALSTAKGPVAGIFLILFIYYYLYRSGRVNLIRDLILFSGLIFIFPLIVLYLRSYGMETNIIKAILWRLFYVPAEVLYYYFEIFPDEIGYLHGLTIGKIAWFLGEKHFDSVNYVFQYMYPGKLETGHANAAFIGNLNADFGMIGVLFGGFLAGFLIQWINIYLIRRKKTILSIAVYSVLIMAFWKLSSTALPVVLLSHGVILMFIISPMISLLCEFLIVSTRPHNL